MWRRLRALLCRARLDRELDAEIRFHVEMETQKYVGAGMRPEEARRQALRNFGSLDKHRAESRDTRGVRPLEELGADVRYALRTLRRSPGFSAVAIGTLGLGIAANTAIFSVMNGAYFARYPLRDPKRLIRVYAEDPASGSTQLGFSRPRFEFFREHQTSFSSFAAVSYNGFTLEGRGDPEQIAGAAATSDFLDTFGASPLIGRFLGPGEESGGRVVVLGERFWQRRLAGDPSVLGRPVTLSGVIYTVVGVAPRLPAFWDADVWLPDPFVVPGLTPELVQRGVTFLAAVGRLAPGVSEAHARLELQTLTRRYREGFSGNADSGWLPATAGLRDDIVGAARPSLLALLGAVGLLLVVACANVANLLLVRFAARRQEIAVRTALGASRGRIARQFLVESAVLGLLAAAAGAAVAAITLPVLLGLARNNLAFAEDIRIDLGVLAVTTALALVAGLLSGVLPAFHGSRTDLGGAMRDGGRSVAGSARSQRASRTIVAGQVAVSLVLLVAAGLLVSSFRQLRAQPPGFGARDLFIGGVNLPPARYPDPRSQEQFYVRLAEAANATPGVMHAVLAQRIPLLGGVTRAPYASAEGRIPPLNERPLGMTQSITPGYFQTLQIPLLAGRDFTERDTAEAPLVAVLSASTARRLFPGEPNVTGRRIIMGSQSGGQTMEVVGVVGDVRSQTLATVPDVEFYRPVSQRPRAFMQLVVRTPGDAEAFEPAARRLVAQLDPALPLIGVTTLQQVLDGSLAQQRLFLSLVAVFACVALLLSTVGLYGVVAHSVEQRRLEIGVRMALGARAGEIVRLVVRQSLGPIGAGLIGGLAAAVLVSPVVQRFLFNVSALDVRLIASAAGLLGAVALVTCVLPARRASRTDPLLALRGD